MNLQARHKRPGSEEPLTCDRVILLRCIRTWFGSVEAFEQHVQHEVGDLLAEQLSNYLVSFRHLAEASPIFFWVMLDATAWHLWHATQRGDTTRLLNGLRFLYGLSLWLGVVPILFRILFRVAWMLQSRRASLILDRLMTLLLVLVALVVFCFFVFLDYLLQFETPPGCDALGITLIVVPLAVITWHCLQLPKPHRSHESMKAAAPSK